MDTHTHAQTLASFKGFSSSKFQGESDTHPWQSAMRRMRISSRSDSGKQSSVLLFPLVISSRILDAITAMLHCDPGTTQNFAYCEINKYIESLKAIVKLMIRLEIEIQ